MTVPQSESSGFFIVSSSRCRSANSVENAGWHCNSRAAWWDFVPLPATAGTLQGKQKGRQQTPRARSQKPSACVILGGKIPINDIPEGGNVIRPAIPVVDIIGMLPDIAG